MSNPARLLGLVLLGAVAGTSTLVVASHEARASGGVLSPQGAAPPAVVDVEVAVAITPFGTTRWTRLTAGGAADVIWLVPARPGASLDWASDAWFSALHDATAPRVAPPPGKPACDMPSAAERPQPWSSTGPTKTPRAVTVHTSESELRAHAASRGFAIATPTSTRIAEAYARGYALVAVELEALGSGGSSPTLRVTDDGGAIVPLALTGNPRSNVRITALVIGEGSAELPGTTRELAPSSMIWGPSGSNYAKARASLLAGGGGRTWLRESASREALVENVAVPWSEPIPPLTSGYFRLANGQPRPACEAAAASAWSAQGLAGRACPAGALATVPGGVACTPSAGAIDPSDFACGPGVDDLALALSGTAPSRTVVSRFTGLVLSNNLGLDLPITTSTTLTSTVSFVKQFAPCPVQVSPSPGGIAEPAPTRKPVSPQHTPTASYASRSGGCSGSSTTVVSDTGDDEEVVYDEEPADDSSSWDTSDDGESCSGNSSSSSSTGGWDTSDDDDSDDSSGWDSDDSDDSSGWDSSDDSDSSDSCGSTSDESSAAQEPARKSPRKTRGGGSPVSRYALLFVALLLPLRRRLRVRKL